MLVHLTCLTCSEPFTRESWNVGTRSFCSRPCSAVGNTYSLAERLARHTQRTDGCWLWTGTNRSGGYGSIGRGGRGAPCLLAHRAAWEIADGKEPPSDLHVGHTCDIRNCVRNDEQGTYVVDGVAYPRWGHLFLCPPIANEADKVQKGRQARGNSNGRVLHPDSYPKGTEWPMAKLTDEDVINMRHTYARREMTQMQLAAKYAVRQATVSAIVLNKTWKHLL